MPVRVDVLSLTARRIPTERRCRAPRAFSTVEAGRSVEKPLLDGLSAWSGNRVKEDFLQLYIRPTGVEGRQLSIRMAENNFLNLF